MFYIKDKGIEIGESHFLHVKSQLKSDIKKKLEYYRKDRYALVSEF